MIADMLQHMDGLHALAGLLVGALVGLTGVGGGALMTPLLVLMFGVSPQTAVGTDLLYAATTKMAGSAVHGWRATVDWRIVGRMASGSIPAAILTLYMLSHFGKVDGATSKMILFALGCMLLLTSAATLFQRKLAYFARTHDGPQPADAGALTVVLGALLGVAVSISSVGAGAIGVTALLMLYPTLPVSRIIGTDIAHAVPLALIGGFGHWIMGGVDFTLLLNLLIGSIPGVIVGSLLSSRAPERFLRPILAAVLLLSALKLLTS